MRAFAVMAVGVFLVGCASYATLRDSNRASLNKVEIGMEKSAVVTIMGTDSVGGMSGTVTNPYKRETTVGNDGTAYEILYYYTDEIGYRPIESGLTPIVFRDNRVVGIGWTSYDRFTGAGSAVRVR